MLDTIIVVLQEVSYLSKFWSTVGTTWDVAKPVDWTFIKFCKSEHCLRKALSEKSKKGGKDQESIKLSAKPDLGHHMGKWQKQEKT